MHYPVLCLPHVSNLPTSSRTTPVSEFGYQALKFLDIRPNLPGTSTMAFDRRKRPEWALN